MTVESKIKSAIQYAHSKHIKVAPGIWFEFNESRQVIRCGPLGALLLQHNCNLDVDLARPGFCDKVCEILEVDMFWLRRFWLGFDRNYQVLIETEKKETKDEVSAFGIELRKELK